MNDSQPGRLEERPNDRSIAVILPAAGRGRRFADQHNKLFARLGGEPIWIRAVAALADCREVGRMIMPVAREDREAFETQWAQSKSTRSCGERDVEIEWVEGGSERTDSVRSGLAIIAGDSSVEFVAIHDAARPLVRADDLRRVFLRANQTGAAILAAPVAGTLKRSSLGGSGCVTVDRRDLWTALTPQVFRKDILCRAYDRYRGRPATDDAQLVERMGVDVALVHGAADNLKITYPEDLIVAEAILATRNPS